MARMRSPRAVSEPSVAKAPVTFETLHHRAKSSPDEPRPNSITYAYCMHAPINGFTIHIKCDCKQRVPPRMLVIRYHVKYATCRRMNHCRARYLQQEARHRNPYAIIRSCSDPIAEEKGRKKGCQSPFPRASNGKVRVRRTIENRM